MQIVIELSDELYKEIASEDAVYYPDDGGVVWQAVREGTVLPKHHGRLIDADDFKKNVCTYQQTGCGDCKHSLCCPEDVLTIIEADKTEL